MVGVATLPGGAAHGMTALSPAERQAAQGALARLMNPASGLGSSLGGVMQSATVQSGSPQGEGFKTAGFGTSSVIHGQGSDTFVGGARSLSAAVFPNIGGNDTVVGGSAVAGVPGSVADALGHGDPKFSLSADTINVAGATAAGVKAMQPEEATRTTHTITLADKTTITIAGLQQHDISKLPPH